MRLTNVHLEPCPFCGATGDALYAGNIRCMVFGVECNKCNCVGPQWSYDHVTDEKGELLPKVQEKIKGMSNDESFNTIDNFLAMKAVEDWNKRKESNGST